MLLTILHPTQYATTTAACSPSVPITISTSGSATAAPATTRRTTRRTRTCCSAKILRIDVDHPDTVAGAPYSSPPTNPSSCNPGPRRDLRVRIAQPVAFQLRPARRRQQWVADVGQGTREEVDTPDREAAATMAGACIEGMASHRTSIRRLLHSRKLHLSDLRLRRTRAAAARSPVAMSIVARRERCLLGHLCLRRLLLVARSSAWDGSAEPPSRHRAEHLVLRRGRAGGTLRRQPRRHGAAGSPSTSCPARTRSSPTQRELPQRRREARASPSRAPAGCAWTAVSNASWIAISGGARQRQRQRDRHVLCFGLHGKPEEPQRDDDDCRPDLQREAVERRNRRAAGPLRFRRPSIHFRARRLHDPRVLRQSRCAMNAENSAGVVGAASAPCAVNRSRMSGEVQHLRRRRRSIWRSRRAACPPAPTGQNHVEMSNPGTPASAIVGNSGTSFDRCAVVTASAFNLPAFTCGIELREVVEHELRVAGEQRLQSRAHRP